MGVTGAHEVPVFLPSLVSEERTTGWKTKPESGDPTARELRRHPLPSPEALFPLLGLIGRKRFEGQDMEPMGVPTRGRLRADWSRGCRGGRGTAVARWGGLRGPRAATPGAGAGKLASSEVAGAGSVRLCFRWPRDCQALVRTQARVTSLLAQLEL